MLHLLSENKPSSPNWAVFKRGRWRAETLDAMFGKMLSWKESRLHTSDAVGPLYWCSREIHAKAKKKNIILVSKVFLNTEDIPFSRFRLYIFGFLLESSAVVYFGCWMCRSKRQMFIGGLVCLYLKNARLSVPVLAFPGGWGGGGWIKLSYSYLVIYLVNL